MTSKDIQHITGYYYKKNTKISKVMIPRVSVITADDKLELSDAYNILEKENKGSNKISHNPQ